MLHFRLISRYLWTKGVVRNSRCSRSIYYNVAVSSKHGKAGCPWLFKFYILYFTIICILWHQKPGGVYIHYCVLLFQGIKRCVNEVGVGFMMSANYHPAMKIVKPVRKKLKIKTVFNILGPLLNPARVPYAVIGVYHENIVSSLSFLFF